MHGLSNKGDLTIYLQICACGKPCACNAWFNQVLNVINLNKNMMVYLQFNSIIIENYGIKYLSKINLNDHFLIIPAKKNPPIFLVYSRRIL